MVKLLVLNHLFLLYWTFRC